MACFLFMRGAVAHMALTNFEGAVAVITGGASGIGLATACALHIRGAHVVLADINSQGLQQAEAQIRQQKPEPPGGRLAFPPASTREARGEPVRSRPAKPGGRTARVRAARGPRPAA